MNILKKITYRIVQRGYQLVSYFLNWRTPDLITGSESIKQLPAYIKKSDIENVLIVTDKTIVELGLIKSLLEQLKKAGVDYSIYSETVADPAVEHILDAVEVYLKNNCKGIIAFGGGSSIDCGKGVAASISNRKKSIPQMAGILKVRKRKIPLYAVPTTAGTGSETTIAAVITDRKSQKKYAINDICLIPDCAVLDPDLLIGLPPGFTSTTGMDALCHAVESYIGRSNTKKTKMYSKEAVKLIFENLYDSYVDGKNIKAREAMQLASFRAGQAFTRGYVGYVHAIAHTLGGFYHIPHGLANAVLLPVVLEQYGKSVYKPLAELADVAGVSKNCTTEKEKAAAFLKAIKELNKSMSIPSKFESILEDDIDYMIGNALTEANPIYPVPFIWGKKEMKTVYRIIRN